MLTAIGWSGLGKIRGGVVVGPIRHASRCRAMLGRDDAVVAVNLVVHLHLKATPLSIGVNSRLRGVGNTRPSPLFSNSSLE